MASENPMKKEEAQTGQKLTHICLFELKQTNNSQLVSLSLLFMRRHLMS